MPWSKSNTPPAASKLKGHELDIFVAAANAALKEYKDEVRAIRTGLAAVAKYRESKMTKKQEDVNVEKSSELSIDLEDGAKSGLLQSVVDAVVAFFLAKEIEEDKQEIVDAQSFMQKSMDEELMQATFIVLEPDVVDLHGDTYSEAEVRKACHNFNTFCRKAYLEHKEETDKISFVESYITPDDILVNGFAVKKGTWLAVAQFKDEELWRQAKEDDLIGVSIGAYCKVEHL